MKEKSKKSSLLFDWPLPFTEKHTQSINEFCKNIKLLPSFSCCLDNPTKLQKEALKMILKESFLASTHHEGKKM